ncbi:fimbrial protein [Lelliottia amnigena]|uniref:Fimbrial protein n=1 Tax=Lelliottia amnigena TaxID=61646 RepID=A0ABU7U957_LELAM
MTKHLLTGLAVSVLLSGAPAMADSTSNFVQIHGFASHDQGFVCSVIPDQNSVSLLELPETLIKQGDNATKPIAVHLQIGGNDKCADQIAAGKMAYRFSGTIDNADGTALANSLTDDTAAKGVAIGIFDGNNKPVKVNTDQMVATTVTTFGLQMVQLTGQEAVAGNINALVTIDIVRL